MATKIIMDRAGMLALQVHVDRTVTLKLAEAIAADMRDYVPIDTGDLLRTIRTAWPAPGHARVWFGDPGGTPDVMYHLYVEFGTTKMAAQPYVRPAVYQRRRLG